MAISGKGLRAPFLVVETVWRKRRSKLGSKRGKKFKKEEISGELSNCGKDSVFVHQTFIIEKLRGIEV